MSPVSMLPTCLVSAHKPLSRLAADVGLSPNALRLIILRTYEMCCVCLTVARFLALHHIKWSKTICTGGLDGLDRRLTRWASLLRPAATNDSQ